MQLPKGERLYQIAIAVETLAGLAVVGVMLLLGFLTIADQNSVIEQQQADLAAESASLESAAAALSSLNQSYERLQSELFETQDGLSLAQAELMATRAELSAKSEEVASTQEAVGNLTAELDQFEKRLTDRMAWFKSNTDITPIPEYDRVRNSMIANCMMVRGDTCWIKLACIPFSNEHISKIEYRSDEELLGSEDLLQDLKSIYENKGGDCEDISTLVIAELNYLTGECRKQRGDSVNIQYEVWQPDPGNGGAYVLSYDPEMAYYYTDREASYLPEEYKHYYMACGSYPDPDGGHCTLVFTKEPIASSADIYRAVSGGILVEAQSGEKLDYLASHKMVVLRDGDDWSEPEHYVWHVMTGDDLYDNYNLNGKVAWRGFSDFLAKIRDEKAKAAAMV